MAKKTLRRKKPGDRGESPGALSPIASRIGKRALITGITGQTGSYLAEFLLDKGYAVHGLIRRCSSFNTGRIDHIFDRLTLHYGDILDPLSIQRAMRAAEPDEVYNLAAQSHVKVSFDQPAYSVETAGQGALHVLECVRDYRDGGHADVRFYQASSSEMFGDSPQPQGEATPFRPRSPYACAKVMAFHLTRTYREAYGLHASNGILFNHESPRRGETFVTRKITRAAARIKLGIQSELTLGNLNSWRDWGFAGDYVEAIWMMVQRDRSDDFVIGTGKTNSVADWLHLTFYRLGLDEKTYVKIDDRYRRPLEVDRLRADVRKAKEVLGWSASGTLLRLNCMMVDADMELARREACLQKNGFRLDAQKNTG